MVAKGIDLNAQLTWFPVLALAKGTSAVTTAFLFHGAMISRRRNRLGDFGNLAGAAALQIGLRDFDVDHLKRGWLRGDDMRRNHLFEEILVVVDSFGTRRRRRSMVFLDTNGGHFVEFLVGLARMIR